jgi:hypothetical protein
MFKGKELANLVVVVVVVVVCGYYWLEGEPTLLDVALALERVMNSGPLDHA